MAVRSTAETDLSCARASCRIRRTTAIGKNAVTARRDFGWLFKAASLSEARQPSGQANRRRINVGSVRSAVGLAAGGVGTKPPA